MGSQYLLRQSRLLVRCIALVLLAAGCLWPQEPALPSDTAAAEDSVAAQPVAQEVTGLAVLALPPAGSDGGDSAAAPTEMLNAHLLSAGSIQVLTRAGVVAALGRERAAALTGCIETPCMAEVAETLGVRYVVSGWLEEGEQADTLKLRVVEADGGGIVGELRYRLDGALSDELLRGVADDLVEICGGTAGSEEEVADEDTAEVPYATIVFASAPVSGTLFIDGKRIGATPCRLDSMAPGEYEVRIEAAGYRAFEKPFDIRPGARKKVTVRFVSDCPSLTVLSDPAGATVTVDTMELGTTPLRTRAVAAGTHALKLTLADYATVSRRVQISADGCDTLRYRLVTEAYADSVKSVRSWRRHVAARVTLGAAAAGFWALGLWRNSEVVEALNDAEAAYEKYSSPRRTQSDYDRHWRTYAEANDRADEAAGARNVAYTVGGVFSAGFFLTFLF